MTPASLPRSITALATKTVGLFAASAPLGAALAQGQEAVNLGPAALALATVTGVSMASGLWAARHLLPTKVSPKTSPETGLQQTASEAIIALTKSAGTLAVSQSKTDIDVRGLQESVHTISVLVASLADTAKESQEVNAPLPSDYRALAHDLDNFHSGGENGRIAFYSGICSGIYDEVLTDKKAATHKGRVAIHDRLSEFLLSKVGTYEPSTPIAIVTLGYVATLQNNGMTQKRLNQRLQVYKQQYLREDYRIGEFLVSDNVLDTAALLMADKPDPFPNISHALDTITKLLHTSGLREDVMANLRKLHIGLLEAAIAISGRQGRKPDVVQHDAYFTELWALDPFRAQVLADWQSDDGSDSLKKGALQVVLNFASHVSQAPFGPDDGYSLKRLAIAFDYIEEKFPEQSVRFQTWINTFR